MYRAKIGSGHKNCKITVAGHMHNMEKELMPKRLLYTTISAKKKKKERKVGRPKPRCLDAVIGDTKKLRVSNDVLEKSFRLRTMEKTSWKPIHLMCCRILDDDDDDDNDYNYK